MNIELFDKAHDFIQEHLDSSANPCVACSFGKDSMVVLDIVRRFQPRIPVVYVEQFPVESKHAFARTIAKAWNLNMQSIPAAWRGTYGKSGHVEIVTGHKIGPNAYLAIPTEPMPELDERDAMCGLDLLNEPFPDLSFPDYDAVFLGHRGDDRDIVLGDIPLIENQFTAKDGTFKYLYPLKDWTSKDVWDYHRRYEVPANEGRYGRNNPADNNDVWNLCTRCMSGDGTVWCPKEKGEVPAFGGMVDWEGITGDFRKNMINLENA